MIQNIFSQPSSAHQTGVQSHVRRERRLGKGEMRSRVAKEAATLLYRGLAKEYKQAKERAAQTLGTRVLPSNLEVAEKMDEIAEELEGSSRQSRLLEMRREALRIMKILREFSPRLVGSVWRGTIHRGSDIDVTAFSPEPKAVLERLMENDFRIVKMERRPVTKRGELKSSFHIHTVLPSGNEAEIVVRGPEEADEFEKCEIYGDPMSGLDLDQLQIVLKENPLQRFVPSLK